MEIFERPDLLVAQFPGYFISVKIETHLSRANKDFLIDELLRFGKMIKDVNLSVIYPMMEVTLPV
jgi:hypothetical protein